MNAVVEKALSNRVQLAHFILRTQERIRKSGQTLEWNAFRETVEGKDVLAILDEQGKLRFKRQWIMVREICPSRSDQRAFCYMLTFQTYLDMNESIIAHSFKPDYIAFEISEEQARAVEDQIVKANNEQPD